MPIYSYALRLESPAHPGTRKPYGHFLECHDYIPGSVIRGAVAEAILKHCKLREDEKTVDMDCTGTVDGDCPANVEGKCLFHAIFLAQDAVVFSNAYPVAPDEDLTGRVRPWPLTARECSNNPGSSQEYEYSLREREAQQLLFRDPGHGVWDIAVSDYLQSLLDSGRGSAPPDQARVDLWTGARCRHCSSKAVACTGYCYPPPSGERTWWRSSSAQKMRQSHVALNRRRWSAEEGILFSTEALREGQEFSATVCISERLHSLHVLELLGRALGQEADGSAGLSLGRGGSAGAGRCRLVRDLTSYPEPQGWSLEDRVQKLDALVREGLEMIGVGAVSGTYLCVDLVSDLVLPADPPADVGTWICHQLSAREVRNPQLCRAWLRTHVVSGWDAHKRQAREHRFAVGAGSVLLMRAEASLQDLAPVLEQLQDDHLGERGSEGFGRFVVSDPIHIAAAIDPATPPTEETERNDRGRTRSDPGDDPRGRDDDNRFARQTGT